MPEMLPTPPGAAPSTLGPAIACDRALSRPLTARRVARWGAHMAAVTGVATLGLTAACKIGKGRGKSRGNSRG